VATNLNQMAYTSIDAQNVTFGGTSSASSVLLSGDLNNDEFSSQPSHSVKNLAMAR